MTFPFLARAFSRACFTFLACVATLRAQSGAASAPPTQLAPVVVQGRDTDLVGVASSAAQGIVISIERLAGEDWPDSLSSADFRPYRDEYLALVQRLLPGGSRSLNADRALPRLSG